MLPSVFSSPVVPRPSSAPGARSGARSPNPGTLRVLLVEDDPTAAEAVAGELARSFPDSVVETVESREGFQRALLSQRCDVVLVDDALGWIDVRGALSLVQETLPAAPFIVLARSLDEESVVAGLRAGAEDFILVDNLGRLRDIIDKALSVRRPLRTLSPRQLDVLRLIAVGHTTPGIASRLDRSPKTIETHRGEIMKRLGIHDVVGLVRYAIRVGLLPPEAQMP